MAVSISLAGQPTKTNSDRIRECTANNIFEIAPGQFASFREDLQLQQSGVLRTTTHPKKTGPARPTLVPELPYDVYLATISILWPFGFTISVFGI